MTYYHVKTEVPTAYEFLISKEKVEAKMKEMDTTDSHLAILEMTKYDQDVLLCDVQEQKEYLIFNNEITDEAAEIIKENAYTIYGDVDPEFKVDISFEPYDTNLEENVLENYKTYDQYILEKMKEEKL